MKIYSGRTCPTINTAKKNKAVINPHSKLYRAKCGMFLAKGGQVMSISEAWDILHSHMGNLYDRAKAEMTAHFGNLYDEAAAEDKAMHEANVLTGKE